MEASLQTQTGGRSCVLVRVDLQSSKYRSIFVVFDVLAFRLWGVFCVIRAILALLADVLP